MNDKIWDKVYRDQGKVQKDILPTIVNAVKILKSKNKNKILDLCCGTGRHSIYLAENNFEVSSLDISENGIKILKNIANDLKLKNIKYYISDMKKTPFNDNEFDAIICVWSNGLGTKFELEKSINEMYRILKPEGLLFTDFMSADDKTYGIGKKIEDNTYIGGFDGLSELPNHYCTIDEVKELMIKFHEKNIFKYDYKYFNNINEEVIKCIFVEAVK